MLVLSNMQILRGICLFSRLKSAIKILGMRAEGTYAELDTRYVYT